jgi:hypothetical protein
VSENGPELLPVPSLDDRRAAVPDEPRDDAVQRWALGRAASSEAFDAVGLRAPVALTHRVPDPVTLLQRL